jgi:hypothetical protein
MSCLSLSLPITHILFDVLLCYAFRVLWVFCVFIVCVCAQRVRGRLFGAKYVLGLWVLESVKNIIIHMVSHKVYHMILDMEWLCRGGK